MFTRVPVREGDAKGGTERKTKLTDGRGKADEPKGERRGGLRQDEDRIVGENARLLGGWCFIRPRTRVTALQLLMREYQGMSSSDAFRHLPLSSSLKYFPLRVLGSIFMDY